MKRKKDRSGKVAVIASLVVILLVGVSVFSLYSLSGNGLFGSAGILFGSSENTGMGKLLTHYDETAEYSDDQIQVANVDESYDPTVYPEELTGEIQGSTSQEEITSPAEPIPVDTKLEVKDSAVPDEVKDGLTENVSGSVLKEASADDASKKDETEQTPEEKTEEITDTDEEMIADLSDEIADGAEDVAGTALMASAAEEVPAAVIQPAAAEQTESFQEEEAAVAAEPEPLAEETVEEEPEEVVEEAPLFAAPVQTAEVAEEPVVEESETEETGEWRFDQDTEEWYYVEFADLEEDTAADNNEDTDNAGIEGEWVFDQDTEEWYYVESAALSEDAAADYDEDTDDAETEGEWVFDEETEEWYFETSLLAAAGGDEEDEEEGEWVFDQDTEEWYYVAGTDETDENESAGEWVLDEETGEWIYVEGAGDADDADAGDTEEDTDEDDIIEPTGEWVFDEEAGEWVYVETEGAGGDGDGTATEEAAAADEETVSLGQQIVDYAMGYVGVTPYVWAGNSLTSGTDCSGFVHLIYDKFGVYCSHASLAYDGSEFGTVISAEEAQPGDIAVYGGGDHVAIYAGNGYVVHCSSPRNGTVYWDMNYRSDLSWFLRVL